MTVLNGSPLLLREVAASGGDAYQIEKSLRFNNDDSAYLKRSFSASNRRTWTWSGWVKKCSTGDHVLWHSDNGSG